MAMPRSTYTRSDSATANVGRHIRRFVAPGKVATFHSGAAWACVLAGLSGMAGLAHQMIWTRRLVDLLGASPFTFSKVVGAFFLGLAAGSALAAIRSDRVRRPWRWVACVELSIAALSLPVLLTPQLADALYQSPHLGIWLKQLIPFLFVTPPAIAMGLVIPWMLRALNASSSTPGTTVWLYAANTIGGVMGIVCVLLLALPALGLTGAGLAVCGLNVVVAAVALWLGRVPPKRNKTQNQTSQADVSSGKSFRSPFAIRHSASLLALGSGFLVLALEVVLQHQFAQVTINSFFSSGTVLAWGLLSLAAGSALTPWLVKRVTDSASRLRLVLLGAAILCAIQPFIFTWLRSGVNILPYELSPGAYTWEVGCLAMMSLCPLFFAAGLLFPLLLHVATSDSTSSTSRRVAVLLAWNGLGGWLGSEIAQLLIAPLFGLWQSIVIMGLGYALLGMLVPAGTDPTEQIEGKRLFTFRALRLPLSAGVAILAAFLLAGSLPQISLSPGERLAALQVGREGVVATVECGPGDWRMLFNNSYTLGGSKARSNQERQAHLPILLHGHARSVGIMGVATGGTLSGAALHPGIEHIDAAELSPLVIKQAGKFFSPYSRDVFDDPRVHLFTEDARWMVATQTRTYDVVIGDLFLPWRTGEGRLFSVEHFQAVRRALKTDGVFCQWLPLFQLTRPQFEAIARSFQQVFPDAIIVRGDFYTELPVVGLIGGCNLGQIDWEKVEARCEELRAASLVTDPLARHAEGVAMMIIGALPALNDGPINTLGNAWLEWDCGRNILGMRTPWFIGVPAAEFVRDIHRDAQAAMPAALRAAHDAGQFFLTLEITAKLKLPQFQNFAAQIPARLPAHLQDDAGADWEHWPMRVKPNPGNRAENPVKVVSLNY